MTASRQALQSMLDQLDALQVSTDHRAATVQAARRLNRGSALLAASVLLDSAVEHYRGSFANRAMYTPLLMSTLTLAISAHGTTDRRPDIHWVRHGVAVAAAATGLAGTGFHIWNVLKRPGRLDWQNLFYGAPVGAPMAILLAGLLGTAAEWVRDTPGHVPPRLFGVPAGRALAALSGLGLLGTSGEAALLHFRGAFQNKAMFAPVTLPPVGAALLLNAAVAPKRRERWLARVWLRLTMLMGLAGVGFHAWGIHRAMGGWRNWSQNVVDGPPLPAPPSFPAWLWPGSPLSDCCGTTRMPDRYPGYDVMAKRHTQSWNEQTRRVIDRRLAVPRTPRFLSDHEFATVEAIAAQIVPQPVHRPPVPVAALIDAKLLEDIQDGFRAEDMPRQRTAWQRGLRALDAEAQAAHGSTFCALMAERQCDLLLQMKQGALSHEAWGGMSPANFFKQRLLHDIVAAYWSHPTAWNEIGWGGPASPRGYVRMGYDERDPWEAAEAPRDANADAAHRKNRHVG